MFTFHFCVFISVTYALAVSLLLFCLLWLPILSVFITPLFHIVIDTLHTIESKS